MSVMPFPSALLFRSGTPVSVRASYLALAPPLLDQLQGRAPRPQWHARLAAPWNKVHERLEFLRGQLRSRADGGLDVAPHPADGSPRLRAAADADALLGLGAGGRAYTGGTVCVGVFVCLGLLRLLGCLGGTGFTVAYSH